MPRLSVDLEDGRTAHFEAVSNPQQVVPPRGKVEDLIVGAHVEGWPVDAKRPSKGPDLIAFDPKDGGHVLVIEIKGDIGRTSRAQFSDERVWQQIEQIGGVFAERHAGGEHIRLEKQLWRPDLRNHALWVYVINPIGDRVEPPTYYRLRSISLRPPRDEEESSSILPQTMKQIDTAYIKRRVDDWERRVKALFKDVKDWTAAEPEHYEVSSGGSVPMNEELMQRFAVAPRSLPVLTVSVAGKRILTFKPYALWIIAGNGRIDVIGRHSAFLVDRAHELDPPQWQLFFLGERRLAGRRIKQGRPFNANALSDLLADL